MIIAQNTIWLISALLTGLIAGLLFGYACSVNIGLHKLSDLGYLSAMQSINQAILGPVFLVAFTGPLIALPVCARLSYQQPPSFAFYCMLAASLVYLIGVFMVTILFNVPLNTLLAKYDLTSVSSPDLVMLRKKIELPWNRYHLIRTVSAIASFILALLSALKGDI
jgi:uncharacterized membrane protein